MEISLVYRVAALITSEHKGEAINAIIKTKNYVAGLNKSLAIIIMSGYSQLATPEAKLKNDKTISQYALILDSDNENLYYEAVTRIKEIITHDKIHIIDIIKSGLGVNSRENDRGSSCYQTELYDIWFKNLYKFMHVLNDSGIVLTDFGDIVFTTEPQSD